MKYPIFIRGHLLSWFTLVNLYWKNDQMEVRKCLSICIRTRVSELGWVSYDEQFILRKIVSHHGLSLKWISGFYMSLPLKEFLVSTLYQITIDKVMMASSEIYTNFFRACWGFNEWKWKAQGQSKYVHKCTEFFNKHPAKFFRRKFISVFARSLTYTCRQSRRIIKTLPEN